MSDVHDALRSLQEQLVTREAEVARLRKAVDALSEIADTAQAAPVVPGTTEAIQLVMLDARKPMTDLEILEELKRRGWGPRSDDPLNAVRAALSRLVTKLHRLSRVAQGTYDLARWSVDDVTSDDESDEDLSEDEIDQMVNPPPTFQPPVRFGEPPPLGTFSSQPDSPF